MNEVIINLQEELEEIFPEISGMDITPDTQLQEIPEWDSMAAINLQVFLEEQYNLALAQGFLNDDTTFHELAALIQELVS